MVSAADILNARILVVDDKDANVQLLKGMLRIAGYAAVDSTTVRAHHDAAGMPKTRIEVHDAIKPLVTLAKIRGILREKDLAPPPPRNLVLIGRLNLLPSAVLEALNAVLEAREARMLEASRS